MRNSSIEAMMVNEFQLRNRNKFVHVEVTFLASVDNVEEYGISVTKEGEETETYFLNVSMRKGE